VLEGNPQIQDSLRYWLVTELDNPDIPDLIEPIVDKFVASLIQRTARHLISPGLGRLVFGRGLQEHG
jgi:hypothetical protein